MTCDCGCYGFSIVYKFMDGKQLLDRLICAECGTVYLWTGFFLRRLPDIKVFCRN